MTKREIAQKPRNPFIYEGYEGPDYFCDRTEETERLISHLQNGVNVTLISSRKMGKTGLIKHAFHHIKETNKDAVCIYVDIFHTQNQFELIQALGNAIVRERLLDSRGSWEKIVSYFSHWRPTVSFDALTGNPTVSVAFDRTNTEHTLESIFKYLNDSGKEVFVAIDEFQTITEYPEKGTEALLRSYIQFIHNVHFVFSGSKQHLMYEMFGSPKRPFYQSTSTMTLHPMHEEIYYAFAEQFFKKRKGELSEEVFHHLYKMFNGHTWYLQSVLNRLYEHEKKVTSIQQVNDAVLSILADKSSQYETLMMFLTENQFNLLKAISAESIVKQPQGTPFIQKYGLPNASSVRKALNLLIDKDLIYHESNGYSIYDRFLNIWLQRIGRIG